MGQNLIMIMYNEPPNDFISIFILVFFIIIGVFVYQIASSFMTWKKDDDSPRITTHAKVVSKRIDVRHYHHNNGGSSSTKYFVTFESNDNKRMEVHLKGKEYGILVEGDIGSLTYQGTRYIAFERNK